MAIHLTYINEASKYSTLNVLLLNSIMFCFRSGCRIILSSYCGFQGTIDPKNDWLHLKIDYDQAQKLTISYRDKQAKYVPFIEHKQENDPLTVRYMILRSGGDDHKRIYVLWRINNSK